MNDKDSFHEGFDHGEEIKVGSPRLFGVVFAVVFAIIALWPLLAGSSVLLWSAIISILFLSAAFVKPDLLQPLNWLWFQFGMLLHKIVNPLIMGFLFFLTVTPIAMVFKLIRKDPLNRELDRECQSYWIKRDPKKSEQGSMKNQF